MDRVSQFLPQVLQKRGLAVHAAGSHMSHVAELWISEKLPHLSSFVRVLHIKDGTLSLACDHSVALMECQAAIEPLMQYLKQECPFSAIQQIRVCRQ